MWLAGDYKLVPSKTDEWNSVQKVENRHNIKNEENTCKRNLSFIWSLLYLRPAAQHEQNKDVSRAHRALVTVC